MKKMNSQVKIFLGVIAVLAVGTAVAIISNTGGNVSGEPGQYDDFAKCIANSGTKFYGAFWCPHCQEQKKEFGSSEQYLPYVECSTPNAQGQTQVCKDQNIKEYPTWKFPDGSVVEGVQTFAELSQKTSCPLPGAAPAVQPNTGASSAGSSANTGIKIGGQTSNTVKFVPAPASSDTSSGNSGGSVSSGQ